MRRRSEADITKKVLKFILDENLIEEGDRIVVALSGGVDSVTLLHVLLELSDDLKISIVAAHLNHMLRKSSSRDEEFVKNLCEELGVELHVERIDVKSVWKGSGRSLEEVARQIRYDFLRKVKDRTGSSKIATAHHMDDLLETILYRLVRGTGPFGLIGMEPKSKDLIRPFLRLRRMEIEEYAKENGLKFVLDETNYDRSIPRNFIRHEIVPLLENLNPSISSSAYRLSKILLSMRNFFEPILKDIYEKSKRILKGRIEFKISESEYLISELIRLASMELSGRVPEWIKIQSFLDGLKKSSHRVVFWENFGAWKSFDRFIVGRLEPLSVESGVEFGVLKLGEFEIEISEGFGGDFSTFLRPEELRFRARRKGDRIGRRKLKDLLIDEKIPAYIRDELPLLVREDEIIWVPGIWKNENFEGEGVKFRIVKSPIEM